MHQHCYKSKNLAELKGSIFSNSGRAFRRIRNPKSSIHDILSYIHTQFGFNWSSNVRGEDF